MQKGDDVQYSEMERKMLEEENKFLQDELESMVDKMRIGMYLAVVKGGCLIQGHL